MAEDRRDLFGAGGPDAAPNPSHLREKTAEELLNELEVELDDMSEADYDQAWVDAYLDELDRREPPGADAAAEPALERFHAAHAGSVPYGPPPEGAGHENRCLPDSGLRTVAGRTAGRQPRCAGVDKKCICPVV